MYINFAGKTEDEVLLFLRNYAWTGKARAQIWEKNSGIFEVQVNGASISRWSNDWPWVDIWSDAIEELQASSFIAAIDGKVTTACVAIAQLSNKTAMSVTHFFARKNSNYPFLAISIGENGKEADGWPPFFTTSPFEAMWRSEKDLRVDVKQDPLFAEAMELGNSKRGQKYYVDQRSDVQWWPKTAPIVLRENAQDALRFIRVFRHQKHLGRLHQLALDEAERLEDCAKALWPKTGFGHFLAHLGFAVD